MGPVEGPDYSIEISVGDDDPVWSFAFHVRGGDLAAGVVAAMLDHLDLRAIDTAQDADGPGFFDPATAAESPRRWREFRDRAVASLSAGPLAMPNPPAPTVMVEEASQPKRGGLLSRLFGRD